MAEGFCSFDRTGEVAMQDLINEFMSQKRFAIVGATDDPQKYGNEIFKNLRRRL